MVRHLWLVDLRLKAPCTLIYPGLTLSVAGRVFVLCAKDVGHLSSSEEKQQ